MSSNFVKNHKFFVERTQNVYFNYRKMVRLPFIIFSMIYLFFLKKGQLWPKIFRTGQFITLSKLLLHIYNSVKELSFYIIMKILTSLDEKMSKNKKSRFSDILQNWK